MKLQIKTISECNALIEKANILLDCLELDRNLLYKKPGIYILTSPSGKMYIGQTTDLYTRLHSYKGHKCVGQNGILNALNKYGFENFKIDILFAIGNNENIRTILDDVEIYLINKYNSTNSAIGYNIQNGGYENVNHSDFTKHKISESLKGKKQSKETIEKRVSKIRGSKRSQECKDKISKTHSMAVEKYTKDGIFVEEYLSATQAAIKNNLKATCSITEVCNNKRKSAAGFIFKYKKL